MSIFQNRALPSLIGAVTALTLGLSLAATGSASAQRFYNPTMASSNGAEVLTGFGHTAYRDTSGDRCAVTNGAEILGGFKSGEAVVCRR